MFGPKHVPAMGGAGYRFVDGNYMAFNVGSGKTFTQVNIKKVVNSATLPKRGGETIVGHALQKHAGRNPHIWGKVKGGPDKINEMALNHLNEILEAPGYFVKIKNRKGIEFLEKRLSDGRGVRLNLDGSFKGFID